MSSISLPAATLGVVLTLPCEPATGSLCGLDQVNGLARVKVQSGTTVVVRDGSLQLDSWSAAWCASTHGSYPYSTNRCEGDVASLAWQPNPSPASAHSCGELTRVSFTPAEACDADGNGDAHPCDGVILYGEPSVLVKESCAAAATTLDARDAKYGRARFVVL